MGLNFSISLALFAFPCIPTHYSFRLYRLQAVYLLCGIYKALARRLHLGWQDAILIYIMSVIRLLILDRQAFDFTKISFLIAEIRKKGNCD